jgi:hypothetical protein
MSDPRDDLAALTADDITLGEIKQRFPRYSRSMGLWGKDAMWFLIAEVDRLNVELSRAQFDLQAKEKQRQKLLDDTREYRMAVKKR